MLEILNECTNVGAGLCAGPWWGYRDLERNRRVTLLRFRTKPPGHVTAISNGTAWSRYRNFERNRLVTLPQFRMEPPGHVTVILD